MRDIFQRDSASAQFLNNCALKFRWNIYNYFLEWLASLAMISLAENHLRLGNLHLVSRSAHIFEQNCDMEFSAAENFKAVCGRKIYFESDIDLEFALEKFPNLP